MVKRLLIIGGDNKQIMIIKQQPGLPHFLESKQNTREPPRHLSLFGILNCLFLYKNFKFESSRNELLAKEIIKKRLIH